MVESTQELLELRAKKVLLDSMTRTRLRIKDALERSENPDRDLEQENITAFTLGDA